MAIQVEKYSFLKIEKQGPVAVVRFNRPENLNRWKESEEWEMIEVLRDLEADDDVHVVLLTGSGDTFCNGAYHNDSTFEPGRFYERSIDVFGAWMEFDKPVVVALNGTVAGSGLSLMMLCDIVVAEQHQTFGDPHVCIGVVSATGPFEWPLAIGLMRAKRYLLTGESMDAAEAERIGLVTEVVETGGSFDRAMEFAQKIAAFPSPGVRGTKRVLQQWLRSNFNSVFLQGLALEFLRFPTDALAFAAGNNKSSNGH